MPTLEFKITVPDGTTVAITGLDALVATPTAMPQEEAVERYLREYLSDNTRKLFRQAAAIETSAGPATPWRTLPSTSASTTRASAASPRPRGASRAGGAMRLPHRSRSDSNGRTTPRRVRPARCAPAITFPKAWPRLSTSWSEARRASRSLQPSPMSQRDVMPH